MFILIADDEINALQHTKDALSSYFTKAYILEAHSGHEALLLSQNYSIDLAILDIQMPGYSGLEVARELRKKDTECKIFLLTAYSKFDYAKEAIDNKIDEYLLKPINSEKLISALQKYQFHDSVASIKIESKEEILINNIKKFIEENYTQSLNLDIIANEVSFSKFYISRIFNEFEKTTINDYINKTKINHAKKLLLEGLNIAEIASLLSFNDVYYFSKVFKKHTSLTPASYIQNIKNIN